jgi:hypothetical protein
MGGSAAKAAIVRAVRDGLLREKTAARELAKIGVSEADLGGWLEMRRWRASPSRSSGRFSPTLPARAARARG